LGNIDSVEEDVFGLEQIKKYASDLYNKRINVQGGVHEGDKYADALGDIIGGVERAIGARKAEAQDTPPMGLVELEIVGAVYTDYQVKYYAH
jgi:hypothetical protein